MKGKNSNAPLPPDAYKTLYRAVGLPEWRLIVADGKKRLARETLTEAVFYPSLTFAYACKLAKNFVAKSPAAEYVGLVAAFDVPPNTFAEYDELSVDETVPPTKLWIPATAMLAMNATITGIVRVVETFYDIAYNGVKFTPQELNEVGFL